MTELVYRLTYVCPQCQEPHVKRGSFHQACRGAAYVLDQGSPYVEIGNEGFMQEIDLDFSEWLACKGVELEAGEWDGILHGVGGPQSPFCS